MNGLHQRSVVTLLLAAGALLVVLVYVLSPSPAATADVSGPKVLTRIRHSDAGPGRTFASVQLSKPAASISEYHRLLSKLVREAKQRGARYVCTPEPVHAISAETIPGASSDYFSALADREDLWLAISLIEQAAESSEQPFSTTLLIGPDGQIANRYRKVMVPANTEAIQRGDFRQIIHCVDDDGVRLGILAGDDLLVGIPRLADRGAHLILITAAWKESESDEWYQRCAELSKRYQVNLAVANAGDAAIFLRDGTHHMATPRIDTVLTADLPHATGTWSIASAVGLPKTVPVPSYRQISPELVELGRQLFTDTNLSSTGKVSCASCHRPEKAFSNQEKNGEGVHGRRTSRNVPSLLNVAFRPLLRWDGYASSIENFMKYPISGFHEMNFHYLDKVSGYLRTQPHYVAAFRDVMGVERIGFEHVEIALATYQRTLISGDSPFDRYYYQGDASALSDSARRGLELFLGEADCARCHTIGSSYALFSDLRYHFVGVGYSSEPGSSYDLGLGGISTSDLEGKFQTPPLRDVANTAPYMHDGSQQTLEEVVDFFAAAENRIDDPRMELKRLSLSNQDKQDLVAFLRSLSGSRKYKPDGTLATFGTTYDKRRK